MWVFQNLIAKLNIFYINFNFVMYTFLARDLYCRFSENFEKVTNRGREIFLFLLFKTAVSANVPFCFEYNLKIRVLFL